MRRKALEASETEVRLSDFMTDLKVGVLKIDDRCIKWCQSRALIIVHS